MSGELRKQKYESEELGGCGKGADCVSQKQVKLFRDENLKDMSQLLLLGKFEYTGGPIFKVVLEC